MCKNSLHGVNKESLIFAGNFITQKKAKHLKYNLKKRLSSLGADYSEKSLNACWTNKVELPKNRRT